MKPGTHLQQRADPAAYLTKPLRGVGDPGENLQQGALSCAIPAHNPQHLPAGHIKGDISQRPDRCRAIFLAIVPLEKASCPLNTRQQHITQGIGPRLQHTNAVLFGDIF